MVTVCAVDSQPDKGAERIKEGRINQMRLLFCSQLSFRVFAPFSTFSVAKKGKCLSMVRMVHFRVVYRYTVVPGYNVSVYSGRHAIAVVMLYRSNFPGANRSLTNLPGYSGSRVK